MNRGIPINLKNIKTMETGVFNPVAEIGKLSYEDAKELMWECYHHQLTEDEYPLLSQTDSPIDFSKRATQLRLKELRKNKELTFDDSYRKGGKNEF